MGLEMKIKIKMVQIGDFELHKLGEIEIILQIGYFTTLFVDTHHVFCVHLDLLHGIHNFYCV